MGAHRWGIWSVRKERPGGRYDLSKVSFSWLSGWRQMRSMNIIFSTYIKEPNQVWDYLSCSWCTVHAFYKNTHFWTLCSPWPWVVASFTEPHDKWAFLAERTSPSTPIPKITCSTCLNTLLNHPKMCYLSQMHYSQRHAMKPTDTTLNKPSSNTHMSETGMQDRTLKHLETSTLG